MTASFSLPMIFAFGLFWVGAPLASADDGQALLERTLAAHGGLERFRAFEDWHIVAERNLSSGDVTHEIYEECLLRVDGLERTLLVKKRDESTLVYGHDGREGFTVVDGQMQENEDAAGEAYYRAHGEYYLRAIPFKWVDPGMHVEYAGKETNEGTELDLLRISAEENVGRAWKDVWMAAIDAETHLLFEARLTHHRDLETWTGEAASGTTEIVYRYGDYREVKGLQVPFRLEYLSSGKKTGENLIRSIEIDAGVSRSVFEKNTYRE